MPRLIDTDARRLEIAEASWRLIERQGLGALSVRNVAREAGLSAGSLRHAFPTQADLLSFTMAALGERALARIEALDGAGESVDVAERMLGELLPLDAERRREAETWLAFVAQARPDPELAALGDNVDTALRAFVLENVERLGFSGSAAKIETERLYALIDGLTMHALANPERLRPATMRRVLRRHLESLISPNQSLAAHTP